MSQYLLLYHDPHSPKDRVGRMEQVARMDMFEREIGNAILDGGSPTVRGKKITLDDIRPLRKKTGTDYYCIIEASDPYEAVELARGAPPLYEGGSAEVYEIDTDG